MTNLAVLALESPERIGADVVAVLEAGPGEKLDQWLLLLAAVLYSRPGLVSAQALAHLDLDANTRGMAGEVLKFAISSPIGSQAVEAAMRLLSKPNNRPEVYEAVIGCLRYATCWAMNLLDVGALIRIAEAGCPQSLIRDVLEPCLYASDTIPRNWMSRLIRLYDDSESAKYCVYFLQGGEGLSPELQDRFPWHGPVANRLGRGRRRILVVHNINDGQGDEIVRTVPLMQALLDFNVELEIVLVTRRVYLYAHPRIRAVPIGEKDRVANVIREEFDGLIDFFDPNIKEVNYDLDLEASVDEFRRRRRPFLDIASIKGYNHFLYQRVEIESRPLAGPLGLDRRRVDNNYEPTERLIAELGLPLRRGQALPRTETVLAGIAWPEAERYWQAQTSENREHRPIAMLSPYGGAEPLKGYTSSDGVAAEIRRLVGEGFFVVVMPNGASWGSTSIARDAVSLLPHVVVGPAPDAPLEVAAGGPLSFPDLVMRLVLHGVQYADLIVTVEGWMMHAAWCLGKEYRVLMLPYSHSCEWHPYGRARTQGVFPAAGVDGPMLLNQPRKFVFLFLLRELGKAGLEEALPLLRRAIASEDRHIRLAAAEALAGFRGAGAEASLAPLLQDPSHEVRAVVAQAFLDRSVNPAGVLRAHLQAHSLIGRPQRDWGPVVRLGAAAIPVLKLAAGGDDPVVRREAAQALRVLDFKPGKKGLMSRMFNLSKPKPAGPPKILILTPVKDAEVFIPDYYKRITRLSYPSKSISLAFLESDSKDGTRGAIEDRLPRLRKKFSRVGLWKKDFAFRIPPGVPRWEESVQPERRSVLAKSRNHLLFRALEDEDWVLWLDVDVIEYPNDILERLLATGRDIVQPHCVLDYGGPTFDKNAWRDHGRLHLEDMRQEGELVELDAVGGTMLLIRADLHREGLIFPAWPYGRASARARASGEFETEGLGIMARDMGYQCWGMPHLEIRHGKW